MIACIHSYCFDWIVKNALVDRYTMPCPDRCEFEVHQKIMLPCWNPDPSMRPGFAALMESLIDLGAVPPAAHTVPRAHSAWKGARTSHAGGGTPSSVDARGLLGPSVHHITMVLLPRVMLAVRPPWKDKRGNLVSPPESATISHAVQAVIKPHGAEKVSPRDGLKGASYVDTLRSHDDVGRATALLSCEFYRIH